MQLKLFFLLLVISGILLYRLFLFYNQQLTLNKPVTLTTTLLSQPSIQSSRQIFSLTYQGRRVTVITSLQPMLSYGDTVRISGIIKEKVLENEKTALTIQFPKIEPNPPEKTFIQKLFSVPLGIVSSVRADIVKVIHMTLSPTEAGLLLGIVFGIKQNLPKELVLQLQATGVMHIIAASGMNVTLVAGLVSSIALRVLRRQLALLVSLFAVGFYAVLSGLDASILRASLTIALVFCAELFGRQHRVPVILFLTGYLLLLFQPQLLVDLGFQLSFLATAGLIFLKPLLDSLKFFRKIPFIKDDLTTTLAAQLTTLPLIVATFGVVSVWSLVVNCLILWVIGPLMVIGGVVSALALLLPFVASLLYLTLPFLQYLLFVIKFFSQLPILSNISFPWQFLFCYYCLLVAGTLLHKKTDIKDREV